MPPPISPSPPPPPPPPPKKLDSVGVKISDLPKTAQDAGKKADTTGEGTLNTTELDTFTAQDGGALRRDAGVTGGGLEGSRRATGRPGLSDLRNLGEKGAVHDAVGMLVEKMGSDTPESQVEAGALIEGLRARPKNELASQRDILKLLGPITPRRACS